MGQKTGMLKKEKNVQNRAINDARVSDSLKLCVCVCGGGGGGGLVDGERKRQKQYCVSI